MISQPPSKTPIEDKTGKHRTIDRDKDQNSPAVATIAKIANELQESEAHRALKRPCIRQSRNTSIALRPTAVVDTARTKGRTAPLYTVLPTEDASLLTSNEKRGRPLGRRYSRSRLK